MVYICATHVVVHILTYELMGRRVHGKGTYACHIHYYTPIYYSTGCFLGEATESLYRLPIGHPLRDPRRARVSSLFSVSSI